MAKQVTIYDFNGKEKEKVNLPDKLFAVNWNADLVHQVITCMESNARVNTAHTKDRSEVRGGGRKPWRQKGTGSARHGSRRSPLWIGGGVTFGPRKERNYNKKINKKMRVQALLCTLSQKLKDNQILFVDKISLAKTSTKEANQILEGLEKVKGFETINTNKNNNILLVMPEITEAIKNSFKNIAHVTLRNTKDLNPVDIAKPKSSSEEEKVEIKDTKINNK